MWTSKWIILLWFAKRRLRSGRHPAEAPHPHRMRLPRLSAPVLRLCVLRRDAAALARLLAAGRLPDGRGARAARQRPPFEFFARRFSPQPGLPLHWLEDDG
ncbi:hypothetical protein C8R46DRAFT_1060556, partial [Mycena filopes]